jgi:pyruvate/2-oxoglutarate dehydrogenase complex dihydrolipoamide dehydrogenase (E3) component
MPQTEVQELDVAVVGAGSAGPKAARTAAKSGAQVAIFEEALIGGECLYTGCVPSKALIHSATLWDRMRRAPQFGLPAHVGSAPDFGAVMRHARRTVEEVGGGSAVDGFARQGIATVCERARFLDPHTLETSKTRTRYRAKQVILCTGSLPAVPPIPGLEEAGYDTNRTVFSWDALPPRIVILGGGAIGCELGQVFRRFGAAVTILHNGGRLLARDDADAAQVLHDRLVSEGVRIVTHAQVERVTRRGDATVLTLHGTGEDIACDAVLVAAGRKSNVGGLNLEAAGVRCDPHGRLKTNSHLQTDVAHVWAAGDVTSEYKFTHVASYEGAVAATNALAALRGDAPCCPADYRVIPRVTYTDPEVAGVGLTPALARMTHRGEDLDIARFPFAHLDKAVIVGDTQGFVQIVSGRETGAILGAQIVGPHAGGLINEVCLAMRARLPVSEIALTMHAYPTLPEAVEAAALTSSHAPLSPCPDSYTAREDGPRDHP